MFLLRELELLLDEEPLKGPCEPRCIGPHREAKANEGQLSRTVRAESVTDPADLCTIAALEAEPAQSLRYLEV